MPSGRSLMRRGKPPHICRKQQIWHRTADDTTGHREGVTTMANNQKIDNVSIKISVESIQELVVGSSISPIRLEKRLPLSFTGRMGTTLGDQWVPPERLRRGLFDHSRDQASSPAGLATTS